LSGRALNDSKLESVYSRKIALRYVVAFGSSVPLEAESFTKSSLSPVIAWSPLLGTYVPVDLIGRDVVDADVLRRRPPSSDPRLALNVCHYDEKGDGERDR